MTKSMITVGIVSRILRFGGTERVIAQLSCVWKDIDCRLVFLTASPASPDDFHHVCHAREQINFSTATNEVIKDVVQRNAIQVMVFNDGWNDKGFCEQVRLLNSMGLPIVCINHHAFSNWAFFLNNYEDFFKDEVKELIDALVCVNPIQGLWWQHRGFKVAYIPNPVVFLPSVANLYKHGKQLVWIGRPLDIGKRLPLMLMIFAEIKKRVPDVHLIVAGQITDDLQKELLKSVNPSDRENIKFAGYLPNSLDLLTKSSVHVLTSLLEVTSPQVLLESAVVGVPTVMFELPTCFDATREHGVIQIPEGDLEKFVEEVVEIISNPAYAQDLSNKALRWGQFLSQRDLRSMWHSLFQSLLNRDTSYFARNMMEIETLDNYKRTLMEVCRSEKYFVSHYFHILKGYKRIQFGIRLLARKLRFY